MKELLIGPLDFTPYIINYRQYSQSGMQQAWLTGVPLELERDFALLFKTVNLRLMFWSDVSRFQIGSVLIDPNKYTLNLYRHISHPFWLSKLYPERWEVWGTIES